MAGSHWNVSTLSQASDKLIITGTAAPVSVFGRAANSHAFHEFLTIFSSCITNFVKLFAKVNNFVYICK
jgi:hypothetical protein